MTFTFAGTDYTLPDSLDDITITQYASWTTTYGKDLEAARVAANAIADESERNLTLSLLYMERMTKALAYYSTIPLSDVQDSIDIRQVLSYVGGTQLPITLEDREVVILSSYEWSGDTWELNAPLDGDIPDYAAFRATQDLAHAMLALSESDWTVMSHLCAAYLRLPGETTMNPTDAAIGSAREILMRDLPMSIALPVAHYLADQMNSFITAMESYVPA